MVQVVVVIMVLLQFYRNLYALKSPFYSLIPIPSRSFQSPFFFRRLNRIHQFQQSHLNPLQPFLLLHPFLQSHQPTLLPLALHFPSLIPQLQLPPLNPCRVTHQPNLSLPQRVVPLPPFVVAEASLSPLLPNHLNEFERVEKVID